MAKKTTAPKQQAQKPPTEIEYDFIKSNFFRVIRADGAFGGVAPNGAIHMQLFSERQPIPTKVVHPIKDGRPGPEILAKRMVRKAIVREVEIDVVFDLGQAVALRTWLDDKINQLGKLMMDAHMTAAKAVQPTVSPVVVNAPHKQKSVRSAKNVVRRNRNKR